MSQLLGLLASAIALVAYVPYVISILKGKTKPNRTSWLLWALTGVIFTLNYLAVGATDTIWLSFAHTACSIVILVLSIKYGTGGWSDNFDRKCILGSALGLITWFVFNAPLLALLMNILVDLMAGLPTIRKVYFMPGSEDLTTWILFFIANLVNLFAIDQLTLGVVSVPIYGVLHTGLVLFLILRPKINLSK